MTRAVVRSDGRRAARHIPSHQLVAQSPLEDSSGASPPAPAQATIANLYANGTTTDAPSFTATGLTFTAGKSYLVFAPWTDDGATDCVDPLTISTDAGFTFDAAVCPGSDGSTYARSGATRRLDFFVGHCLSTVTGRTVTLTVPAANGNFGEINVIIDEITNPYYVSAATDCLVQAIRLDGTVNGTTGTVTLGDFVDPINNAGWAGVVNGTGGTNAWTAPVIELSDRTAGGGAVFGATTAWAAGQQYAYTWTWSPSASAGGMAIEIRGAGTAAANPLLSSRTVGWNSVTAAAGTITLSVPFVSGRQVLIFVDGERADDPRTPSSVASPSFTFTQIVAQAVTATVDWETIASPDRRLTAWIAEVNSTGTETVTVTWPVNHGNRHVVAVELIDTSADTGTSEVQVASDREDSATNQVLAATLAPFATSWSVVIVGYTANASVGSPSQILPAAGYRSLGDITGNSGTNYQFYPAAQIAIGVLIGQSVNAGVSLVNGTARDCAMLAIEISIEEP